MSNKSVITINVSLDENKHPQKIEWSSTDDPQNLGVRDCKSMMVSFFDAEYKDTYKIDLWTKEMQIVEMDRFVFQSLKSMADTYYNATKNAELASAMMHFAEFFGQETEIIPKEDPVVE